MSIIRQSNMSRIHQNRHNGTFTLSCNSLSVSMYVTTDGHVEVRYVEKKHDDDDDVQSRATDITASMRTMSDEEESATYDRFSFFSQQQQQLAPTTSSLLQQAERLYFDDKLLEAGRILRYMDSHLFDDIHHKILEKADRIEVFLKDLKSNVDQEGWTKIGSTETASSSNHAYLSSRNTGIYYRIDHHPTLRNYSSITARVETPIEASLIIPLLSVLNEVELYSSWFPQYSTPKFKLRRAEKIHQGGVRGVQQIIKMVIDLPYPLAPREVMLDAACVDDVDEKGNFAIRLNGLGGEDRDGLALPPAEKGTVRANFRGGFLFRPCPLDHPALKKRKRKKSSRTLKRSTCTSDYYRKHEASQANGKDNEKMVLLSFSMYTYSCKKNNTMFPQSLVHYLMKIVVSKIWNQFLRVAEEIRIGERPEYCMAIEENRELLYDWLEERIDRMLVNDR